MEWLDRKYINLLSSQLRNFKWQSDSTARCSCPICGDSKTSKLKARLYFIVRDRNYRIYCHNCGASMAIGKFINLVNPSLYNEYNRELVFEKINNKEVKYNFTIPKFAVSGSALNKLKRISQLPPDHPAKVYVENRKIPANKHYRLYYCSKFNEWTNQQIPNKLNTEKDEDRLIIPFFSESKEMFAYQGRAFNDRSIRYITITLDTTKPKIYGLDTIDFNRQFYVVEGPLDSLFLDNCIAMAGSADSGIQLNKNAVYIYDNEPRNKEIVKFISKAIEKNFSVVIWPKTIKYKDINEMVLGGMSVDSIMNTINDNTYTNMQARLKFMEWKKI